MGAPPTVESQLRVLLRLGIQRSPRTFVLPQGPRARGEEDEEPPRAGCAAVTARLPPVVLVAVVRRHCAFHTTRGWRWTVWVRRGCVRQRRRWTCVCSTRGGVGWGRGMQDRHQGGGGDDGGGLFGTDEAKDMQTQEFFWQGRREEKREADRRTHCRHRRSQTCADHQSPFVEARRRAHGWTIPRRCWRGEERGRVERGASWVKLGLGADACGGVAWTHARQRGGLGG